jgi:DNA-binding transcriptional MerR regulator
MKSEKEKLFYSIKEVSNKLHISESLLRFWEKEFPSIHPGRTAKGARRYCQKDIDEVCLVHYLVKEIGMTISGARHRLKWNRNKTIQTEKIINSLKDVRTELLALRIEIEELDNFHKQSTKQ